MMLIIQQILEHLALWQPEPLERGPPQDADPADSPLWPAKAQLPLEFVPVPEIAGTMAPLPFGRTR